MLGLTEGELCAKGELEMAVFSPSEERDILAPRGIGNNDILL